MNHFHIKTDVGIFKLCKLSDEFCYEHSNELLFLINIIPHIRWTNNELMSHGNDFYGNKWNYSYVVKNARDKIIGVIIAYFRIADSKHIFDSLYLHKFVIAPQYQNRGVGTAVLEFFIHKSFEEIPWLLNISVQTNDCALNKHVIQFYRHAGFKDMYNIEYPDKIDILMLLERKDYVLQKALRTDYGRINLKHPRINTYINNHNLENVLPVIYFSSGNEKKREMIEFIFHNYNIDVIFVKPPIELTEPQVESPELEAERKLVSLPLKAVSRFITTVPYIIEDTMLFIEFFNRYGDQWELPGLDTKRWLRQLGLDGILEILGDTSKRKAKFVSQTGAYVKANKYFFGRGEVCGSITNQKAEIVNPQYGTYPYFFHLIFVPDGADKTLAEMDMHEYAQYDYMRKSVIQLVTSLSAEPFSRPYTLFDKLRWE